MKSYWKFVFVSFFTFTSLLATAQENCSNGVDDDGDGLIDCYDGDCSSDGDCDDFFFGNVVNCADEIEVNTFAIREQWGSADQTATSHTTPAVGDLDGNGIPEVISVNNYGTLDLYVLNGATGATMASADIGFTPENAPVIAEIDGDEIGDIIVSQNKGDDLALYNYDPSLGTLTQRWRERASVNQPIGVPGVADFDEDGDVEIYYRNEVMDALTGTVIIAGDGDWEKDYTHGSIAVDILPDNHPGCSDCEGLELISGNEIWSINEAAGTRTLIEDMDDDIHTDIDPNLNYYPKYYPSWDDQWSSVSVADYNLDGHIDVLVSGALGTSSEEYDGETTIFFWDVFNGNVITYHDPSNNFVRGPGRINIGDVDGDGQLNANFVMNQKLYSLDENFNIHWIHPIKEGSSGFTGCSLFDFDGDGAVEVVYRSEESLLIVDGVGNGNNTTNERNEIACISRTQEEYPVIADVDGDGSSEICVSCYTNNSTSFSPYSNTQFSQIRVYESDGEAWMPARGIWNQHGYYNVNINDDLTIPTEVQDHSVVFSDGTCEYADGTPVPFPSRPLNTFINQAPILNEDGCVEFASPDIEFKTIISASDAQCPDAQITVEFVISNEGDIAISGFLPVSYYFGDPTTVDGILLDTENVLLENFEPQDELTVTQTVDALGGDFELFVVINDNGSTPPIPDPPPTATIPECDTNNNIQSTLVGYQTFDLTVEKLTDNRKCDPTKPDNGSARAYYFGPAPGSSENIWVENFEDRTAGAQSDTDDTGWTSDGGTESPDFFGVTSYSGSNMFGVTKTGTSNDVGIVTWTSEDIDISNHTDINVSVDIFEDGDQEGSGEWRDFVIMRYELRDRNNVVSESGVMSSGSNFGDFTYESAFLTNLNSDGADSILVITAQMHNTASSEHHFIDNIIVDGTGPDVTDEYTEPDGFVFRWYNDDDYSSIIYEGSQYPQMATGIYDVVGFYAETQCYSDTVEIEIELINTPSYDVHVYEISALTECSTPDGSLGAFAFTSEVGGIPQDTLTTADGYSFTWFIQSEGVTPIATGNIASNLDAIGYTVEVLEDFSGCTVSDSRTVSSTVTNPPDPTVGTQDIIACGGTGELSANVAGNTADYTFEWYDGPSIKPSPDFTGSVYEPSDPGEYTVTATLNSSGCTSNAVTVTLNDISTAPNPGVSLVQDNTSCVAGNGIVSADGDGAGTVSGFTFEWFLGANTLSSNALPGTAAPGAFLVNDNEYELGGLEEGTYTVRVTDISTNCVETRTVDVTDTPGSLTVTAGNLVVNDINSCDLAILGSIDASGVVPGSVTDVSIGNINSDFESPDISEAPYNTSTFTFLDQDELPGWSTTAGDDVVELWNDGFLGVPAYSGDQFAEILANQIGALYFDLSTVPGSLFNWSFAHRGRSGDDNILVSIGEIGAVVPQKAYTTGTTGGVNGTGWMVYDSTYTVPEDQFVTRFQFESLDPGSIGNFVDSVTFVLFPYRFELYEGATVSGDPDYINTSGIFGDLDEGDYVLVVYDNLTGCGAVEIPFVIDRDITQPTIATTITDDAHCDDDAGEIEVSATMSTTEPGDYTYELFQGHSFSSPYGSSQIVASGSSFTFNDASGYPIAPGDYRVRVTNNETNCSAFEDMVVDDITEIPVFTASQAIVDNTACGGTANGFISVSIDEVGFDPDDYRFFWYDGDDSSDPAIGDPLGVVGLNFQNNLDAGDYTVITESIASGCETVELTLTVDDDPFVPVVVITQDDADTSCDEGNGQLSAHVTSDPDQVCVTCVDNYTFEWYYNGTGPLTNGDDLGNNSDVLIGGTNGNVISGISSDANNYTVIATHNSLNCDGTESAILTAAQINPEIAFDSKTPNTVCDDSNPATEYTGSITMTSTYDGSNFTTDPEATYEWYVGSDMTGTLLGETSNVLSNVQEGFYTVRVLNSATGCPSNTATVEVLEAHDEPIISFINAVANTVCDPALADDSGNSYNGAVEVDLTSLGGSGDFDFQWFTGASATPGQEIGGATTEALSGVQHGTYTVEVTDNITGCVVSDDFSIGDNRNNPTLVLGDIDVVDVTVCSGAVDFPNGQITVTTVDGFVTTDPEFADYSFQWYTGAGTGSPIGGESSNVLSNRAIGEYTVRAVNDVTGCISPTRTVEIEETLVAINAAETIQHYTNCVSPNASIVVLASMADASTPSGYTFEWFFGSGTSEPLDGTDLTDDTNFAITTTGTDQTTASGLEDGTYTVRITNDDSQCTEVFEYVVEDNQIIPVVDEVQLAADVTDNTVCDPAEADGLGNDYDGVIDPQNSVTPAPPGTTYLYRLFDDTDTEIATTTTTFTNVAPGDYTVVAEITDPANGGVGCQSTAGAVTVGNNLTLPDFDLTGNPDVLCSSDNGSIDIDFTGTIPADGFEIEIFTNAGATISQEFIGAAVSTFPQSSSVNLTTGTYHVRFINNTTGCSAIESVFVNEVEDTPTMDALDVVKTDDTFCNADNGSIAITVDDSNAANNIGNDPIFRLYQGNSSSGTLLNTQQPGPGTTSHTFSGLAQGTYTVTVEKVESGCTSNEVTRTVNEVLVTFSPSITEVNQQTSCDLNDPNGELSADADGGGTVAGYTFEWFRGTSTNPAQEVTVQFTTATLFGTNNSQVRGLPAGTYTVKVTDNASGCFYTEQATLINQQVDPAIVGGVVVDDSDQCSPGNGSLTITVNDAGSADPQNGSTGYTFELFEGTSTIGTAFRTEVRPNSGQPNDEDTFAFTGLSEGDYTIRVTDNSTSCLVVSATETVGYDGESITYDVDNIFKDPLSACFDADGILDFEDAISAQNGLTGDVIIHWYIGTDTSSSANLVVNAISAATFTDGSFGGFTIDSARMENLPAIVYTGVIEYANGCKELFTTELTNVAAPEMQIINVTDPTRCKVTYDGSFDIFIDPVDGDAPNEFNYFVFEGNQAIAPDSDTPPTAPYSPNLSAYGPILVSGTFTNASTAPGATETITIDDLNVANGLPAGVYTVAIEINDADRCITNVQTVTLADPEEPSVVLNSSSDNTVCDITGGLTYNGSISVTASHPSLADNADFVWYEDLDDNGTYSALFSGDNGGLNPGFNVTNETENGVTTNTVSGLGAGKYRVIIENNATACEDTLDVEIFDDPLPLDFDEGVATLEDQLDCTGGPAEFGVFNFPTIDEDGAALGAATADGFFDITWEYDANQDGTFEVSPYTPNNDQNDADDLAPGDYRLSIVSLTSGCTTEHEFTISDESENPVISLVGSINDNTICDGGPTNPNGSITIQIEDQSGVIQDPADFAIQWYKGSVSGTTRVPQDLETTATTPSTATTATLDGVDDGNYIVEVTNNGTPNSINCTTESTFFVVADDLAEIEIQQLEGVDFTIGHQTFCNPDENGIITITNVYVDGAAQDAATGNFEFSWFESNMTDPIGTTVGTTSGANNQIAEDLPAGTYYAEVLNEDDDCVSDLVSFTIDDDRIIPNLQTEQLLRDSVCTTTLGSGSVLASVILAGGATDAASEYTFEWYQGAGNAGDANFLLLTPATDGASVTADGYTISADGEQVDDLPAGVYEVIVTNNAAGSDGDACSATSQVTVQQFTPVISIATSDITIFDNQNCSPSPNGFAEVTRVTVTSVNGGSYFILPTDPEWANLTWEWYDVATGGLVQDNDERYENLGLGDGTYYVTISDWSDNGCAMSNRKEVIVEDDISPITLTLTEDAPDNFCAPVTAGNGQVSLAIDIDGFAENAAHYTIEWFEGSGTGTVLGTTITGSSLSTNEDVLSNIPDGTYTVRVTKDDTGAGAVAPSLECIATAEITLTSEEEEITLEHDVDYTRSPNTVCDDAVAGNFDGSISITDVTEGGAKVGTAGFNFTWTGENGTALPAGAAGAATATLSQVPAGIYEVTIENDARDCFSEIIQIEVEEDLTFPTLSLNITATNTHCDGAATFTGEIEATAAGGTGVYTFAWHDGQTPVGGTTTASISTLGAVSTASNLDGGFFTVVATDANTGCTVTETGFVDEVLDIFTLNISTLRAQTEPDTLCGAATSGTIIINDGDILDGSGGDLSNYNISVTDGGGLDIGASPFNGTALTTIEINNVDAGDYNIDAVHINSNCAIATGVVNVKDSVRNPQIALVSMTPDQDCGGGVNAGELVILIDGQYNETNHFDVQWFTGSGATGGNEILSENSVSLSGYPAGDYSVEVRNQNTDCSIIRNYTITNVPINPSISDFSVTENNVCDDDLDGNPADIGSFELLETTFNGSTLDQVAMAGNYQLEVYDNETDATAGNSGAQVADGDGDNTNFIHTALGAGTYFAIVRKIDSDCYSGPVEFDIIDNVERPLINIVLQVADSTCAPGGTSNGELRATVELGGISGIDDTDPDYKFEWYAGTDTTVANIGTTSTISGLDAGMYTAWVLYRPTGCVSAQAFNLPNVPTNVEILAATTNDATNCDIPSNGRIEITSVNRDNIADYTFEYYDVDPTDGSPSPVFTGIAGAPYTTASAGVHYIIGTNTIVNCTTPIFEVEVLENFTFPEITLDDFSFQTNCDPDNPNGRLNVLADGVIAGYSFEWFLGDEDSYDPLDPLSADDFVWMTGATNPNLAGQNTNEVSGLPAVRTDNGEDLFYTVIVTNTATQCTSLESFQMVDDVRNPIPISTSSSANTDCVTPDGKMAVSVIDRSDPVSGLQRPLSDWSYYWFRGDLATVGTNPDPLFADFTGTLVEGVEADTYVVMVVDNNDNVCSSIAQVVVEDGTEETLPEFIVTKKDVTVCFDDKDGFVSVQYLTLPANSGKTINHQWVTPGGSTTSAMSIDSLEAGIYRLIVTNVNTGCFVEENVEIFDLSENPNIPTVIVNNGRDNCSFANGSAIADVDGLRSNFLFEWFDPSDMSTPYTTGAEVSNLDSITYLVQATNLSTGCTSDFASIDIGYEVVDPEFEVVVENSLCLRTEDGSTNQFTGRATVSFTENQDPTLVDYEWVFLATGEVVSSGDVLDDAYPGDYGLYINTDNGCDYYREFTMETSLNIYNGVSANGDGKNDFFLVDCIDFFPNNNVKIYNRAGQKLYEADGYNNTSVRFEGYSNVGGGGLELPSGTYFYVIDLSNGEDPKQGYLELVR